jgi:protein SCO1
MLAALPIRRMMGKAILALTVLVMLPAAIAHAQASSSWWAEKSMGDPSDKLPSILDRVKVVQKLGAQLPLDAPFVDSDGKSVKLGDYFGKRPVILALVYYRCQILCSEELNGLVGALEMLNYAPGKDFDVVVATIDPTEGPQLAHNEKALYLKRYDRPGTTNGWHFLTGPESSIQSLTQAVGFGYVKMAGPDGKMNQFAHTSSIQIVTPEGKVAQYFMGVEYSPKDLKMSLVAASHYKIGTPVDEIMTYCYHYDPRLNRHSMFVARIVQLGCLATAFCLGGFMFVNFRRDIQQARKG